VVRLWSHHAAGRAFPAALAAVARSVEASERLAQARVEDPLDA
jgi:hypothetical protein